MKHPDQFQLEIAEASRQRKLPEFVTELAASYFELYKAIEKHMSATGHDLCWENDLELWKHLDPSVNYPHHTLPAEAEFELNCKKYYLSRKSELAT